MKINEHKISECLNELESVLATMDPNSDSRDRLEEIIRELNEAQHLSEKPAHLEFKIDELIRRLEVEHPRITNILNDLMVTLTGIGV